MRPARDVAQTSVVTTHAVMTALWCGSSTWRTAAKLVHISSYYEVYCAMKPSSFLLSGALIMALGGVLPGVAAAASLSFLNQTIATHIPAKDLPTFQATVAEVLNQSADGQTTQWSSTAGTPRRAPVQIALTPLQTTQTQAFSACRLLAADIMQNKMQETWKFWFCKQADGHWKASGGTPQ